MVNNSLIFKLDFLVNANEFIHGGYLPQFLFDTTCCFVDRCLKPEKTDDTLCALDLTGPLFVGGLPEYLRIDRLHSSYFVGCIRDFHMNFELVDYNLAVTDHNTQEGCVYKRDYCINSPCRNSGLSSLVTVSNT